MPTINIDSRQINFREFGSGLPVFLLHCSSSHSGQWKSLADQLSDHFKIYTPDFFGYGRSDSLPKDDNPFFEHDIQILEHLLEPADSPVHLVGHSLGGVIATYFALRHSRRVASLTLIEPVLFNLLEESGDNRGLEYLKLAQSMLILIRFGKLEEAARIFLDFWIGPNSLETMDKETRKYIIETIPRVADDWYGISMYAPGTLRRKDLEKINVPTLVMCASDTKPSARAIVEILCQSISNCRYEEIPEAGHMSPISNPEVVNKIIADFLMQQINEPI